MKSAGFSLLEMLMAMAIGAVLMVSVGRFLPLLLSENVGMLQRAQLRQELQQNHGHAGEGGTTGKLLPRRVRQWRAENQ